MPIAPITDVSQALLASLAVFLAATPAIIGAILLLADQATPAARGSWSPARADPTRSFVRRAGLGPARVSLTLADATGQGTDIDGEGRVHVDGPQAGRRLEDRQVAIP